MTRVVVTIVDANGQTVPQARTMVSLSVTGPAEFQGESPVALEDGTTAFFVKTRADRAGTVICRARSTAMKEAYASIRVSVNRRGAW